MSKLLDKIAPEIKLYKYLGNEINCLKRVFDRNWAEKGLNWKLHSVDWMIDRLKAEVKELDEAMTDVWEDAFLVNSLLYRLEQVLLEWQDCALVCLMGADRTRMEIEALRERLRAEVIPTKEVLSAEEIDGELVEVLKDAPVELYESEEEEHDDDN